MNYLSEEEVNQIKEEAIKKIRIEYEQLTVQEALLREKLAAIDTEKAELRVRMVAEE